ncbi:MAG TPA: hypothetical protein VMT37_09895 [Solirubrobacterales bacterium]|nr:hypothetical protein [Solirubrobacterales bacterium]
MPWVPELFSAAVLAQWEERRQEVVDVPYFDGLASGEVDALVESFGGEPRIQHPLRGLIAGEEAFREFVADVGRWLLDHDASVEDVQRSVLEQRGFEEVVIHLDTEAGRIALPHGLVADHDRDGLLEEIRVYFSTRPLTGHRADRPPLLAPDPELSEPDAVAEYGRALAAGDARAVAAAFEAGGYAREADTASRVHIGADALCSFYGGCLSEGAVELEPCVLVEDDATCALEYNLSRPGATAPQAGFTVFVHGEAGKLAAVRIYDDLGPR